MIPFLGNALTAGKHIPGVRPFEKIFAACGCFAEGTKIRTIDGLKAIEEIQVGDFVLAKDEVTGDTDYKPVTELYNKEVYELFEVHVGEERIAVTGNHPFWVSGKGWVLAEDLRAGDLLVTRDQREIAVDQVFFSVQHAKVYNITVEGYHTYFATNLEILISTQPSL